MWSRLCPTPFGTWTCWSRGPSSWLLWRLTMLRRMRRQRSGPFYILGDRKGKSNHQSPIAAPHQDETDTCVERKNDPKAAPVENGLSPASAPAGHTPVTTTPKASAASQQTVTTGTIILQTNTQQSVILLFVSLILLLFLTADSAKPAAKSEDLVLGVLIGLYYLNLFYFKTIGFAVKLSSPCWRS